jgi:carbamoyl-phosphate synthase large subunit
MAMGRTFRESLQKALRGLETGVDGLTPVLDSVDSDEDWAHLHHELSMPGSMRLWYVADAFRFGMSLQDVHQLTRIDPWFLDQIRGLVSTESEIAAKGRDALQPAYLRRVKRDGFSDSRIATLIGRREAEVRVARHRHDIRPVFKRVDSCAAEFASSTAYMYSTYEEFCEANPTDREKIMILGGGPNRIGQGIEFDYCCVHASFALREAGYETIMVNCNPETVSTDYDTSDRLYFEPLTLEDVLEIVHKEKPRGVIVQYGGQTPLKLARALEAEKVPIIGTSPDSIDLAEDRERFQKLVDKLELKQPPNRTARTEKDAIMMAREVG